MVREQRGNVATNTNPSREGRDFIQLLAVWWLNPSLISNFLLDLTLSAADNSLYVFIFM